MPGRGRSVSSRFSSRRLPFQKSPNEILDAAREHALLGAVVDDLVAQPVVAAADRQDHAVADLEILVEILGLLEHLELDAVAAVELELHRRELQVAIDDVVVEIQVDVGLGADLHAAKPAVAARSAATSSAPDSSCGSSGAA